MRGRLKIVRLSFEMNHKLQNNIPENWLAPPVTRALIERLRAWKVSDKNISLG